MARNIVIGLLLVVLLPLGAELGTRLYLFGTAGLSPEKMNSYIVESEAGLTRAATAPGLVYELIPNANGYLKTKPFRTNALGMRDNEVNEIKEPGTVRIAVIGDSFTVGSGLTAEEAFPQVLEDAANRWGSSLKFEVFNMAVPGYGVRQYAAQIEHKVLPLEPDLIIVGWNSVSNHQPQGEQFFTKPFQAHDPGTPFLESFLVKFVREARRRQSKPVFQNPPVKMSYNDGPLMYSKEWIKKIRDVAFAKKVPVVVAHVGFLQTVDPRLEAYFKELNLSYVDLGGQLDQSRLVDYTISVIDPHPDAEAHWQFGVKLMDFLVSRRLLRFK